MKNENSKALEASLKALLTGYCQRDPKALRRLADCIYWPSQAQLEIHRRTTRLLEILPTEDLAAIAAGEVNIVALASEAADTLEKQAH